MAIGRVVPDINRKQVVDYIKELPTSALQGKGLWIGINNHGFDAQGVRVGDAPMFVCLDERAWTKTLSTFGVLGLTCSALKVGDNFVTEIDNVHEDVLLTVRYWAVEIADNTQGEGAGDPRAPLIPKVLTGATWPWPYVYIYAQIQVASTEERVKPLPSEETALGPKTPMFQGMSKGFLKSLPAEFGTKEESKLDSNLDSKLDSNLDSKPEPEQEPQQKPEPERKTYYSVAVYEYPDGTVRTIEPGMYTAFEHMLRTLEEQDAWSKAVKAHKERAKETGNPEDLKENPEEVAPVSIADAADAANATDTTDADLANYAQLEDFRQHMANVRVAYDSDTSGSNGSRGSGADESE